MAKLHIWTQDYENYGAHDWNGEGDCPQYWKAKGGEDYIIPKFKGGAEDATYAVMCLRDKIEEDNEYFRRSVIGWKIVDDKYMTAFEKDQMEYDGKITYKAKVLEW